MEEAPEKKSPSRDGDRKQLPHRYRGPTPQPAPARKRSQKRNVGGKQREPVVFMDEKKKEARRVTGKPGKEEQDWLLLGRVVSQQVRTLRGSEEQPSQPDQDGDAATREDCNQGEVQETMKRLLQEQRSNKEVGDWIQVGHDR